MYNKLIKIKYIITYFKYNYWDFRQQNQLHWINYFEKNRIN